MAYTKYNDVALETGKGELAMGIALEWFSCS